MATKTNTNPATAPLARRLGEDDGELLQVLAALADPTRLAIVLTLLDGAERPCGTFPVEVGASTLSYHFKILREAGVIEQRNSGRQRFTTLARTHLDARFPGLLDVVVDNVRNVR